VPRGKSTAEDLGVERWSVGALLSSDGSDVFHPVSATDVHSRDPVAFSLGRRPMYYCAGLTFSGFIFLV